jgi:anti-anti-sigma regulatory factor
MRASGSREMFCTIKPRISNVFSRVGFVKRLLVISATGHVTKKEVAAVALRIREMMKEVTPGFRVLTDFRWLDRMDPAAATHLAEIMDALAEKKVAAVVRVITDPHKDIGLNILSHSITDRTSSCILSNR